MTEMVFQKKLLEKAYFIVKTTGLAMAVLDFQKKCWGQLAPKFSFLVAKTSLVVAKNYI